MDGREDGVSRKNNFPMFEILGRLAEMYGGKWIFFVAVIVNVICTLLSPGESHYLILLFGLISNVAFDSVCSYGGYYFLILMRILMGLAGGLTFPAMNVLIAEWAPKQERSTMSSLIYGGKFEKQSLPMKDEHTKF